MWVRALSFAVVVLLVSMAVSGTGHATKPLAGRTYKIVVSFSAFTVHLFGVDGRELFVAPVALPKCTPRLPIEGTLATIERNPWWFPTKNIKAHVWKTEQRRLPDGVPPGSNNPMGPVKYSFSFVTPGADPLSKMHGTNRPESIGTRASFGCIRMHNRDALALCNLIEPLFKAGATITVSYVDAVEYE